MDDGSTYENSAKMTAALDRKGALAGTAESSIPLRHCTIITYDQRTSLREGSGTTFAFVPPSTDYLPRREIQTIPAANRSQILNDLTRTKSSKSTPERKTGHGR